MVLFLHFSTFVEKWFMCLSNINFKKSAHIYNLGGVWTVPIENPHCIDPGCKGYNDERKEGAFNDREKKKKTSL